MTAHFSRTAPAVAREQPSLPAKKPGSVARWVTLNPAEELSAGRTAGLMLDVPRARRDGEWDRCVQFYTVYANEGDWHLLREGENGQPDEHYIVDPSFGPKPEHWECNCPSRQRPVCKHCSGLFAALAKIGLAK